MSSPAPNSVCIIIAAYNASAFITRAIESALAQREVSEIIVVDDASADTTSDVAKQCDDGSGRLRVIRLSSNQGPSAARNAALDACTSAWVGILDADDFFLPGRISAMLQHADNADIIADNMYQAPEGNIGAREVQLLPNFTTPITFDFSGFVLGNTTQAKRTRTELGFIKPIIRRQKLLDYSIRYQEAMRLGEDFELYARLLAHGASLCIIPNIGYVSVVRGTSLSARHSIHDLHMLRDYSAAIGTRSTLTAKQQRALTCYVRGIDCRLQWRLLIEALKTKNITAAIDCFVRPWPVPLYLMQQLAGSVYMRCFNRAKLAAEREQKNTSI